MGFWQGVWYSGLRNSVDNLLFILRDLLNYRVYVALCEYLLITFVLLSAIFALCAAAST